MEWAILLGPFLIAAAVCYWRSAAQTEYRGAYYRKQRYAAACVGLLIAAVLVSVCRLADAVSAANAAAVRPALVDAIHATPTVSNEDILGQAVEFNRRILRLRYWNSVPVLGWLLVDRWNEIPLVELR
jgi:hypothetical protein